MKSKLKFGIYAICGSSWPSAAAMRRHHKTHTASIESSVEVESENIVQQTEINTLDEAMPVLRGSYLELLMSDFIGEL